MSETFRKRLGGSLIWLASIIAVSAFRHSFGVTDPLVIQTGAFVLGMFAAFGINFMMWEPKP